MSVGDRYQAASFFFFFLHHQIPTFPSPFAYLSYHSLFSHLIQGIWQLNLLCLLLFKVESVTFESSFMSERASLFFSSVGLLVEYCPTPRKKNISSCSEVICMHIEADNTHSLGCHFMQPLPRGVSAEKFCIAIENTSI
ncbi:hypothetical protein GQ457_01G011910 [Hibiscus cannabinus]